MPFFIDPANAAGVAWLIHSDDIRRAEQSRVARQIRAEQRADRRGTSRTARARWAALLSRRHPVH